MPTKDTLAAVEQLIHEVELHTALEEADAEAWIVCVYDPEVGERKYWGPWTDFEEARGYATYCSVEVNKDTSGPYVVTVHPLRKAQR